MSKYYADTIIEMFNVKTKQLHNIFLQLKKGEILGIIGPSGAGKTSLLLTLNRLVEIDSGSLTFQGKDIQSYPIIELRRKVGIVFQTSSLFDGTVEDNLKFGPDLIGEWEQEHGPELLKQVHISNNLLYESVHHLSEGEKQRVSIARTIANSCDVFLFDEITSALDVLNVELIEQLLLQLAKNEKKAILLVTHNLEQAERLCDRLVFMKEGTIIEQGATAEILQEPKSLELMQFLKG